MKAFLTPLQGLAEFEQIKEKSKTNKGILQVSGCMESQKSHLMYGLSGIAPYRLILAEDERRAREIYEDYRFYDRKVYSYPAKDLLFFQADIHGNLLIRQRMKVIKALLEEKELTVVTSIDGCMDFLESLEKIKEQLIHYESDSTVDTEQLKNQLVALGYERASPTPAEASQNKTTFSFRFSIPIRFIQSFPYHNRLGTVLQHRKGQASAFPLYFRTENRNVLSFFRKIELPQTGFCGKVKVSTNERMIFHGEPIGLFEKPEKHPKISSQGRSRRAARSGCGGRTVCAQRHELAADPVFGH